MLITAEDVEHKTGLSNGATQIFELWGSGIVTNRYSSSRLNFRSSNPPRHCEFAGIIGRGVRFNVGEKVYLMLTGTNSTASPEIAGGAVLGFRKFGMQGERSSMGTGGATIRTNGGTILYLGEGETSNKSVSFWVKGNEEGVIDAGATGGLNLTGTISYYSENAKESYGMKKLVLTGSNTVPCVFSGTLPTWTIFTTNYNFHVMKKGTGTWCFAEKNQTHAGAWTVEDGTLAFESLKQRGTACSLGTSTNLMEYYGGLIDESKRVDWAFALGGATTSGKMEYVGTNDATCSTRPIVLKGMGGTFASSSNAVMRFYGVTAAAGVNAALTLAGNATAVTNVIGEVCDGAGKVSLVKEGDGTWMLGGPSNTFSGSLSVKAGTLCVQDPTLYTWYRMTVTRAFADDGAPDGYRAQMIEFGIWDENNNRINARLYPFTNYYSKAEGSLPEGMCAYWRSGTAADTISNNVRPLEGIFDDGTPLVSGRSAYMSPKFGDVFIDPEKPATWIPIVMHLTNGIGRAASFDFVLSGSNPNRNVKSFFLEGSLDGIHWDYLTNIVLEANIASGTKWLGSGATYSAGKSSTHTGGYSLAGGPTNVVPALANVESVSVAAGARLVSLGGTAPIKGLTVDAEGAGTIENFAFAEKGEGDDCTLDVANLPRSGGVLPGTYVNCTGLANVARWSLKVGGTENSKMHIVVEGGKIRIVPIGLIMTIR